MMPYDLSQPNELRYVPSITTDGTVAPCKHCWCSVDTSGNLRCHRCGGLKPWEPPKEHTCIMCGGTGKTFQARGMWDEPEPDI